MSDASTTPRGWRLAVKVLLIVILLAIIFLLLVLGGIIPVWWVPREPTRSALNEASAIGTLRTINTVAFSYGHIYENGYPPNLEALATPPEGKPADCNRAALLDERWISGQGSGYRWVYIPGLALKERRPGCDQPGAESYVVVARPLQYGQEGRRSFYTNETGVIHWTNEDRAASVADPPLPQWDQAKP